MLQAESSAPSGAPAAQPPSYMRLVGAEEERPARRIRPRYEHAKFPWKIKRVSIFKHGYRPPESNWFASWYCPLSRRKKVLTLGTADLGEAYQKARELRKSIDAAWAARKDPALAKLAAAGGRSIEEHLVDYRDFLAAKGRTAKQIHEVHGRCAKLIKLCNFKLLEDINAHVIELAVSEKIRAPKTSGGRDASLCTCNKYLKAMRQFTRWLSKPKVGRLATDPLTDIELYNEATDPRHQRRAFTTDECRRLLKAAATGKPYHWWSRSIDGRDREMIYLLALSTGLRANEIRTLCPQDFRLDAETAHIVVRAINSKHRKRDEQPLRPNVAVRFREYLDGRQPAEPVWKDFPDKPVLMLEFDLAAAVPPIPYEAGDEFGDFHSLRHTFGTELGRASRNIKTVQKLMRHSDPRLTTRYLHCTSTDEREALQAMPSFT